jgi:hypothetical protein
MAHNGGDPGEREPLGVYWYELRTTASQGGGRNAGAGQPVGGQTAAGRGRGQSPGVEWIRHLVDYGGRMGGGMQIPVVDIDGDGDVDIVCGGKSGLFLVENLTKGPRRPGSERPTR